MSFYLKSGKTFRVTSKDALDLHESLPAGNYVIKLDENGNMYLDSIEEFSFSGKQYGNHSRDRDRILNTFSDRTNSTGVMLAGEKGSGKSLLAKLICMKGAEQSIPTIVINFPYFGDKFNTFIQSIEQPCIVLFDEFEKVYNKEEQEGILTLLDGVFPSKKLFILTCNDKWRVDEHMRNRPGRIYYMIEFGGLESEFIVEYCNDNLQNKIYIDTICSIAGLFEKFNFDMLKAIVEEMNRYDESPQVALKMLNVNPVFESTGADGASYSMQAFFSNKLIESKRLYFDTWEGNPLTQPIELGIHPKKSNDQNINVEFKSDDLKKVDPTNKIYIYEKEKFRLILTRIRRKQFDVYNAF